MLHQLFAIFYLLVAICYFLFDICKNIKNITTGDSNKHSFTTTGTLSSLGTLSEKNGIFYVGKFPNGGGSPPFPLLDVIFGMPTSLWGSKTTNSKFHSPQNYSSATWWNEGKVIGEWELPHKDWHEGAIKRHIVKRQYIVHKRYSPHQSWDIVVSSYQYLLSLSFLRSTFT